MAWWIWALAGVFVVAFLVAFVVASPSFNRKEEAAKKRRDVAKKAEGLNEQWQAQNRSNISTAVGMRTVDVLERFGRPFEKTATEDRGQKAYKWRYKEISANESSATLTVIDYAVVSVEVESASGEVIRHVRQDPDGRDRGWPLESDEDRRINITPGMPMAEVRGSLGPPDAELRLDELLDQQRSAGTLILGDSSNEFSAKRHFRYHDIPKTGQITTLEVSYTGFVIAVQIDDTSGGGLSYGNSGQIAGRKDQARGAAQSWWRSPQAANSIRRHYGICDICNSKIVEGDGFLYKSSDLLCESCFDRISKAGDSGM